MTLEICLGFTILYLVNFLITWGFISFYFWVAKETRTFKYLIVNSIILSLINGLIQVLGLIFLSSINVFVYSGLVFLISLIGYASWLRLKDKLHILEIIIISATLSLIINPFWLDLLGLM